MVVALSFGAPSSLIGVAASVMLLAACSPENTWQPTPMSDADVWDRDGEPDVPATIDQDDDGISDTREGHDSATDTDGDGTPDYLDLDSDDDGIADAIEAGTGGDPLREPIDSDGDGTPDFRDMDSDGNGIFDLTEGSSDSDEDGILDHADIDNDGDLINDVEEIGDNPSAPRDSDGDGTPDHMDTDSDADMIHDAHERNGDADSDGTPDYLDTDTDEDTIPDSAEAGDSDIDTVPVDTDGDGVADFRDRDSDNDGLPDSSEAESGTSPTAADSDGDGVSDLVEVVAGTDALSPEDSPRIRGDFVFVVPYEEPPEPERDSLSFSTDIQYADVYFMMDTTGSMSGAITGLKTTLTGTIIPGVDAAIADVLFGVGKFDDYPFGGYGGGGDVAFLNLQHMTDDPALAQAAVNTMSAGGGADGPESHVPALHAVATGCGDGSIPADPACTDATLIGYPHFRDGAVPIIVLFSDAQFHNGPRGANYGAISGVTPPTYAATVAALNAIHARVIGVSSSSYGRPDMVSLATDTGTVDGTGTPLVYDQYGGAGDFGTQVVEAVSDVANMVPMDIAALALDDETDTVDARVFIDRIVPTEAPVEPCTLGLTIVDSGYAGVLPGSTVCFDIVAAQNDTVEPTAEPQLYKATVQVWGDEVTILDERDIFFLIPPHIEDTVIPS